MSKGIKFLIVISIILAISALGVCYINKFVLPVMIKKFIVNSIKESTGCEVTIGRINYLY